MTPKQPAKLSRRQSEYLDDLKPENFPKYCQKYLRIQSTRGLIRLVANPPQIRLFETINRLKVEGKPPWIIILKARQQGFSTITEAYNYQETSTQYDHRAVIIAHDAKASQHLYGMFNVFYQFFPKDLRPQKSSRGSAKGLDFDLLRSNIRVLTAGNPLGSSGLTFQSAHISELAKWPFADEAYASLMPALTDQSLVIIESTAYGLGNLFHRLWQDALLGKNQLEPLFFPWFENPAYRIKLRRGEQIEPDREERYYVEKFGLDIEQLKWMRWTRQNRCPHYWTDFKQNYPAEPQEAFISTGRTVFDVVALSERELAVQKEPIAERRGEIELIDRPQEKIPYEAQFYESPYGELTLYGDTNEIRTSNIAYRLVFGCDVAEGLLPEHSATGDPDYSVITAWDKINAQQVAFMATRIDPDVVARKLFALMLYFAGGLKPHYWGMAVVERNAMGQVVIIELKHLFEKYRVPFHRMFHRGQMDRDVDPPTDLLGFRTTMDTKPVMIGKIIERVREGITGIWSPRTIQECKTYIHDGKIMRAQDGCHADAVIAYGLVLEGLEKDFPPERIKVPPFVPEWLKRLRKHREPIISVWHRPDYEGRRDIRNEYRREERINRRI